jgi:hypothetical protein
MGMADLVSPRSDPSGELWNHLLRGIAGVNATAIVHEVALDVLNDRP